MSKMIVQAPSLAKNRKEFEQGRRMRGTKTSRQHHDLQKELNCYSCKADSSYAFSAPLKGKYL